MTSDTVPAIPCRNQRVEVQKTISLHLFPTKGKEVAKKAQNYTSQAT